MLSGIFQTLKENKMGLVVAIGPSSFAEEDKTPLALLEAAGVAVKPNPFGRRLNEEEIIAHLDGVDGLIAGLEPLNARVLASAAPRLRALARVGIGVANVDFQAAAEHGVKVSSTPEGPVDAVAEMCVAALLGIGRKLVAMNNALHAGRWEKQIGFALRGKRVLLIGYGRIGRRFGELLLPFGAELLIHDPYLGAEQKLSGVKIENLHEALSSADIVSLHASGESCVLGTPEFSAMRDGAVLLNSARGGLADENALIAALDSGKVSAAWFDAFWQEPYTGKLLDYPQVLMTPHTGTYTLECRLAMESAAVRNLLRDLGLEAGA